MTIPIRVPLSSISGLSSRVEVTSCCFCLRLLVLPFLAMLVHRKVRMNQLTIKSCLSRVLIIHQERA